MSTRTANIISGLTILSKYEGTEIGVGPDVVYAGPYRPAEITEQDQEALKAAGWMFKETLDTWCHFV